MLDTGDGNYLEIFERDPLPEGPSESAAILHFCFRTDDCDAATERARAAGAEITVEPKTIAVFGEPKIPVRLAFFKGPDGEICELFQNEVL
jgi:glyoxylase I family protein